MGSKREPQMDNFYSTGYSGLSSSNLPPRTNVQDYKSQRQWMTLKIQTYQEQCDCFTYKLRLWEQARGLYRFMPVGLYPEWEVDM